MGRFTRFALQLSLAAAGLVIGGLSTLDSAKADCTGGGTIQSMTITPLSANLGSYTPPGAAPADVLLPIVLNYTVSTGAHGSCQFALGFQRPTLPATMSRNGGGSTTVPFTVQRSNGPSLLYSGVPLATNPFDFSVIASSTTAVLNVRFQMAPTVSTLGGSYSDNLTLTVHNRNGTLVQNQLAALNFAVNGTINTSCSIANANNTSQVISVGSTGLTTGMQGAPPQFNVSCNSSSNVSLSSQNGAVTRGGLLEGALTAVSGFRNRIEYQATINGGAGAVSLNTSSGGAAVSANGVFNAAAVTSQGTTVTITPESSTVPLLAGSYSDVLTVTITPQ